MPAVARRDYLKVQLSHPDSELLARWDVWLENLILNQTSKKKCLPVLYFRHLVKLRKKCTRARTHTPHSDAVCQHHLINTFDESITSPFKGGGAFHSTFQNPPPSTAIWNHNADSVTSKYLWWLPTFPLSLPFPEQECTHTHTHILEDTAWLMLKPPAFIPDTCPFHGKNNLSVKVTVFFPKLCPPQSKPI